MHFWTNCWGDSLWYSPGLINFQACAIEFPPFLDPSLVKGFPMHLQTNHWLNWAKIWWANSLQASPGLINFWTNSHEFPPFLGLWLVEQFMFIFRQTFALIELKFGEQTYRGPFPPCLTFGHALLNFCCLLASEWPSSFRPFADTPPIRLRLNLVGQFIMGLPKSD